MKNLIKILFLVLVFSQNAFAQNITKTASKNNVQIGEEFYYTIRVTGITNLSDLEKIVDELGPQIDYIGVDLSSMPLFQSSLFCNSLVDSFSNNVFTLTFNNCAGNAVGSLSSFSFKIKVKLNNLACTLSTFDNEAKLFLKNNKTNTISNKSKIKVIKEDPFKLQKTFRNYNRTTKILTYDIRLSSSTNNFNFLDFNSVPRFSDTFTIPDSYNISPIALSNHKIVFIPDESNLSATVPVNSTVNHSANQLIFDWPLDPSFNNKTSILYQVQIKIDSCTCDTAFFELNNEAGFIGNDICGNVIKKSAYANVPRVNCSDPNGDGNGVPNIPEPITDSIKVSKNVQLDSNDLNLTMKGCTGKYIINIKNTSGRLTFSNFTLTDILPPEIDIYGNVIINGNATQVTSNNIITVSSSGNMVPNEIITIEIPFIVNTPLENILIENCASIKVSGNDGFDNFTIDKNFCSPIVTTVPNTVAVHTKKSICNPPNRNCGLVQIESNLPGDEVEYALHFYNYGTVEGTRIRVVDVLPDNFNIQNINNDVQIFTKSSGLKEDGCNDLSTYKDITHLVRKRYNTTTNQLELRFDSRLKLEAFTCDGVVNYIVKIKAKIDNDAPNGTYDNQFLVYYDDPSANREDVVASNIVSSSVSVDNLIIGNKSVIVTKADCLNKTQTATYQIVLANMGSMPVLLDIEDTLNIPNPVSITNSGIYDIKICDGSGFTRCTPLTTANIPTTSTATSFKINGYKLNPCNIVIIEYKATFNTNLLSKNQKVVVCNNAKVRAYIKDKRKKSKVVLTSNSTLIATYLKANSEEEKFEAIELIKAVKENPEILSNTDPKKHIKKTKKSSNYDFGTEIIGSECITLTDCLNGSGNGCFTDNSSTFSFQITGMNRNGQVSTALTALPSKKVTQIEYLLTDIRQVNSSGNEAFYYNNKLYNRNRLGCSNNVTGVFSTTNTSSLGLLHFTNQPVLLGNYKENNKVQFKGSPTLLNQDIRTFNFPVGMNCNGTYEFTITAIVHFEDCSVCYVTDSFDYNARFRFDIPSNTIKNSVLNGIRK